MAVSDSDEAIRGFMEAGGYTFPMMLDPGEIGRLYEIRAIPTVVIIDPEGRVVETMTGGGTAEDIRTAVAEVIRP